MSPDNSNLIQPGREFEGLDGVFEMALELKAVTDNTTDLVDRQVKHYRVMLDTIKRDPEIVQRIALGATMLNETAKLLGAIRMMLHAGLVPVDTEESVAAFEDFVRNG